MVKLKCTETPSVSNDVTTLGYIQTNYDDNTTPISSMTSPALKLTYSTDVTTSLTADQDLVNKAFVDNALAGLSQNSISDTDGSTKIEIDEGDIIHYKIFNVNDIVKW